jgi:hypothetical protein
MGTGVGCGCGVYTNNAWDTTTPIWRFYQGTTLVGSHMANKDMGFSPWALCGPKFSPNKHFGQDRSRQGLKPNSFSILYGPTKVVP